MPSTYELIASNTVGSGGVGSVTFSSIPSTYTDLLIKVSSRDSGANYVNNLLVTFNASTSGYSDRMLYSTGLSALSASNTSVARFAFAYSAGATATSNTFSNGEIYIPNYTGANNKSASFDFVTENNNSNSFADLAANILANTAAITSVTFTASSATLQQYSTFYLYGIKNN
jgi:hypothetical protein